jgi:transposase InsO family protein
MKNNAIVANRKRKFICTTDSKHYLPVAENKLDQHFEASKTNEKWVTDMDLLRVQHRLHLYTN